MQPTHPTDMANSVDTPNFSAFLKPRFAIEKVNIKFALASFQANASGQLPQSLPGIPKIPFVAVGEHYAFGLCAPLPAAQENVLLSGGASGTQGATTVLSELAPLRQDQLEKYDVPLSFALELALAQLRESMPSAPFELAVPGVYMAAAGNHNPASLLLIDLIANLPICGQAVAIAPHENQVVIAGSSDPVGLRALLEITRELVGSPGGMPALPMILATDGWAPLSLPPNHELFEDFDRLRLSVMSQMYLEQKGLLEHLYAGRRETMWVAPYDTLADGDFFFSQSTLPEGVQPCLLPLADSFQFGRTDQSGQWHTLAVARQEKCLEAISGLMSSMGMYPERWMIGQFPSSEQLEKIGLFDTQRLHPAKTAVEQDPMKIIEQVLMVPVFPFARPKGEAKEPEGTYSMDFQSSESPVRVARYYLGMFNQRVTTSVFDHEMCDFVVPDQLADICTSLVSEMVKDHWRGKTGRKPSYDIWASRFMIIDESQSISRAVSLLSAKNNSTVFSLSRRSYPLDVLQKRQVIPIGDKSELGRLLNIDVHPSAVPSARLVKNGASLSQLFELEAADIDEIIDFYKSHLCLASHLKSPSGGFLIEAARSYESISIHIGRGILDEIFMEVTRTKVVPPKYDGMKNPRVTSAEKKLGVTVYPGCHFDGQLETKSGGAFDQRFTSRDSVAQIARFYRAELPNTVYLPLPGLDPKVYIIISFKEGRPSHAVLVSEGNTGKQTEVAIRAFLETA
jgi:hypothetical protein